MPHAACTNNNMQDALVKLQYQVSLGSVAPPTQPHLTFAYTARPRPTGKGDIQLSSLRSEEMKAGANWTRSELDRRDPGITQHIDRYNEIDEASDKSILFQACSGRTARANAKMGEKGRKERKRKQEENLGVDGRKERERKQEETPGVDGRKERKRKQLESMGETGVKNMGLKVRATMMQGRSSRLGIFADIEEVYKQQWDSKVQTYRDEQKAATGILPTQQIAKRALITAMKIEMLGPTGDKRNCFENWPAKLPYGARKYSADELDGAGAGLLAGILKVKKSVCSDEEGDDEEGDEDVTMEA